VTDYDPQNIFAKILRGEIPAHKVFEDEAVLAMLDLFPHSRGHMLVLPKAPSRNLLDADPAVMGEAAARLPRLAQALQAATGADGIRLAQFNEAAAGQTVFHLHFHLIPIYEGVPLRAGHGVGQADAGELAELAKAIASKLD
jgi:histidine triad (HIT) family protein